MGSRLGYPWLRHAARADNGFTLVELLIVLTLAALGAGLGIQSFRNYREGQRARAAAAEVVSVLTLAKGRAAAANRPAVVDFAPGGLSPSEGFFLVYLDTNMDGAMCRRASAFGSRATPRWARSVCP
jgi:prepilin-type N-terminal cleavage/methylation domain-containing protein